MQVREWSQIFYGFQFFDQVSQQLPAKSEHWAPDKTNQALQETLILLTSK